jgi:hypothetical protein
MRRHIRDFRHQFELEPRCCLSSSLQSEKNARYVGYKADNHSSGRPGRKAARRRRLLSGRTEPSLFRKRSISRKAGDWFSAPASRSWRRAPSVWCVPMDEQHRSCKCGAVYRRTESMANGREVNSFACIYCGEALENWNSAWTPTYRLVVGPTVKPSRN